MNMTENCIGRNWILKQTKKESLGVDHLTFEGGWGGWKNWFVQEFIFALASVFLLL